MLSPNVNITEPLVTYSLFAFYKHSHFWPLMSWWLIPQFEALWREDVWLGPKTANNEANWHEGQFHQLKTGRIAAVDTVKVTLIMSGSVMRARRSKKKQRLILKTKSEEHTRTNAALAWLKRLHKEWPLRHCDVRQLDESHLLSEKTF